MAPALTIPGLEAPEARVRRGGDGVPVADQPPLLQRLLGERPATPAEPAATAPGGGDTLDDLLVGAWEDLTAHRTASCPVCHADMAPRYGAGPEAVGGRCGGCGTTLA